jgi:hypothetical protein
VALEADPVDRHVLGLELGDERERRVALGPDRLEVVVVVVRVSSPLLPNRTRKFRELGVHDLSTIGH